MENLIELKKPIEDMDLFELHRLMSYTYGLYSKAVHRRDEMNAEILGNIYREFKNKKHGYE